MDRTDTTETDADAMLERIRALVTASDADAEAVLDQVAELVSRRRRSHEIYQKPWG